MQNKKGPLFLILTLLIILFFILGVKLGQKVEKTNKTISYVLSLTPSPRPTQIKVEETVKYLNYENKKCGLKFLYPSNLIVKEASTAAEFKNSRGERSMSTNCQSNIKLEKETDVSTGEAYFNNKKIIVNKKNTGTYTLLIFEIKNPKTLKSIRVEIRDDLYPLFERTLQFL